MNVARPTKTTATFTAEFGHEFEVKRSDWLRRRLLWFTGIFSAINIVGMLGTIVFLLFAQSFSSQVDAANVGPLVYLAVVLQFLSGVPYVVAFWIALRKHLSRASLLGVAFWTIVATGGIALISAPIGAEIGEQIARQAAAQQGEASEPSAETLTDDHQASGDSTPEDTDRTTSDPIADPSADESSGPRISTSFNPSQGPVSVKGSSSQSKAAGVAVQILAIHFVACLFLPWTVRECYRPIWPLVILNALILLIYIQGEFVITALFIALSPLMGAPGALVCWLKQHRFRKKFHYGALRRRHSAMHQELSEAQRLHEALLPPKITNGPVRFDYAYEPMRQIGGDFLFCHRFPGVTDGEADAEPLSIVIIDVTGHGIPAALTVNRLHGELGRLFAEEPDIGPGDVLTALNHYVHITLALHSVYATVLCLRVDPSANVLRWASGGHPPAFVRMADGRLDRLDSTAFVLGACAGDDFDASEQHTPLMPGDKIIAYTDGATEARDNLGRMLRVEGLQGLVLASVNEQAGDTSLVWRIMERLQAQRFGPAADDTLIVEVSRPTL